MPTVYDVPPDVLIWRVAQYLKEQLSEHVKPPAWAAYVKTGSHVERSPTQPDWWYIRAASLLRKVYMHGPIGVSRLRLIYGGRKKVGRRRPEQFRRGGGAVIRELLQQLEKAGLVETLDRRGRALTGAGRSLLDKMAADIKREMTRVYPSLEEQILSLVE